LKIVIMAGGSGTRFWPRSVNERPKQFLALTSSETMLQQTYRRFAHWMPEASIYVITTKQYESLVAEQLPELPESRLLLEPEQRDTGPCIALAAHHFLSRGEDDVMVTMPSDHFTEDTEELALALRKAGKAAENSHAIVTLGVKPTRPETGYGYIRTAEERTEDGLIKAHSFIEKPSLETAQVLIREPGVYWNSGIFVWRPSTIAYYMKLYQPHIWNALEQSSSVREGAYAALPKISIDYAILEKAETIYTVPVTFKWDDVGLWTSLARIQQADENGNIVRGSGQVHAESTTNSIIYTDHPKTMVIGVNDLIVVSTSEGLLVCSKSEEQRIKTALKALEQQGGN